jgi:hypothetical protein
MNARVYFLIAHPLIADLFYPQAHACAGDGVATLPSARVTSVTIPAFAAKPQPAD